MNLPQLPSLVNLTHRKCVGDLILVQHQYNNYTTIIHMRVGPSMWDPPSCEGLLYSCCIGVVNLTFSSVLSVLLLCVILSLI
jgi:hypothetical protein